MLKIKVIFFSCAIVSSSLSLAMENNTCSLALSNQAGVLLKDYTMYRGITSTGYPINSLIFKKDIRRRPDYYVSRSNFLNQEAEKEVCILNAKVQRISDQINEHYVGVGEQWSWKRQVAVWVGLSGSGYADIKDVIEDLSEIHAHVNVTFDRPFIDALRSVNYRFDGLMGRLLREKIITYSLQGSGYVFKSRIVGSNLDDFLDFQTMFSGLPDSLLQYIQFRTEQAYRGFFRLKDCVPFVPHVMRTAFRNSKGNQGELHALSESVALKKLSKINPNAAVFFKQLIHGAIAELHADKHCQCANGSEINTDDYWFDVG